ncbi:MAG: amidoligase family protein [Alphaproteobacteria bacterium]|nr:amidoligase family protein [Alphaproteobacteria bacterium]
MKKFTDRQHHENTEPQKRPETVRATEKAFNQYFEMIGRKDFKQFYYDWHIDDMIEPFAELTEYFVRKYPERTAEHFDEFVKEFTQSVDNYNIDSEKFCSVKNGIYHKDRELSQIIDKIETFSFELRQFSYSFMQENDYVSEFGNWVYKPNYPYSHLHGLSLSVDVLNRLSENFNYMNNGLIAENTRCTADSFLRHKLAPQYRYRHGYTYQSRKNATARFVALRNRMAQEYKSGQYNQYGDYFQIETHHRTKFGTYRPNGFELEFYVPAEYGDYGKLIDYLKAKHGWKKVYTTNKDPSVYNDEKAAGVIERDESLAAMAGLAPVEYASRIMKSSKDEKECLKIMDSFDKGYANVHCSLHQHVSAAGFDLNTYKRLVKRMMQHESFIVDNFAAPERRNNRLLYATYISRNLSANGTRDYPFLCTMADMCDNLNELRDMVGFGHKYKTLNIMPSKTVEFRYMNANFNKHYVAAFLQFNRDFVNSAVTNSGTHINRPLANRFNWMQNLAEDDKTVLGQLSYYYQSPYDQFRPNKTVDAHTIHEEHVYARHIADAMSHTGKFGYYNSWFKKKVRDASARA